VHDVEAHVTGPDDAENGVEVGAVVVHQPADVVHGGGDLGDVLLEQAQRVGVRQHDAGHLLVQQRAQGGHVDQAAGVRPHRDRLVPAQRDRGGIGPVGRVGDEDPGALR
jgi:hypothetical protein